MISKLLIQVNGKELSIPVELTEAQVRQIYLAAESDTKMTGYEKPQNGQMYFYEDALGRIQTQEANENNSIQLQMLYEKANCFSSEKIASDSARGDLLVRKLRRAAVESRKGPIDFENGGGYTITYNYFDNCLECGITGNWAAIGDVIFETEEATQKAIAENSEELLWYFTARKDSL